MHFDWVLHHGQWLVQSCTWSDLYFSHESTFIVFFQKYPILRVSKIPSSVSLHYGIIHTYLCQHPPHVCRNSQNSEGSLGPAANSSALFCLITVALECCHQYWLPKVLSGEVFHPHQIICCQASCSDCLCWLVVVKYLLFYPLYVVCFFVVIPPLCSVGWIYQFSQICL